MAINPISPSARRLAARRTSDITRLSAQFRKDIEALTGKQQTALSAYEAGVREKMAPFEIAKTKYETVDYPAYESQVSAYNTAYKEYEDKLKQWKEYSSSFVLGPDGRPIKVMDYTQGRLPESQKYYAVRGPTNSLEDVINPPANVPASYFQAAPGVPRGFAKSSQLQFVQTGTERDTYSNIPVGYLRIARDGQFNTADPYTYSVTSAPKLTAEPPKAMAEPPTAPKIEAFDTSAFETERKGLEAGLQRELGERRAARLAAVSRRGSRPMLQGA